MGPPGPRACTWPEGPGGPGPAASLLVAWAKGPSANGPWAHCTSVNSENSNFTIFISNNSGINSGYHYFNH